MLSSISSFHAQAFSVPLIESPQSIWCIFAMVKRFEIEALGTERASFGCGVSESPLLIYISDKKKMAQNSM